QNQGPRIGAHDPGRKPGVRRGGIQEPVPGAAAGQPGMVAGRRLRRLRRALDEEIRAASACRNGVVLPEFVRLLGAAIRLRRLRLRVLSTAKDPSWKML